MTEYFPRRAQRSARLFCPSSSAARGDPSTLPDQGGGGAGARVSVRDSSDRCSSGGRPAPRGPERGSSDQFCSRCERAPATGRNDSHLVANYISLVNGRASSLTFGIRPAPFGRSARERSRSSSYGPSSKTVCTRHLPRSITVMRGGRDSDPSLCRFLLSHSRGALQWSVGAASQYSVPGIRGGCPAA